MRELAPTLALISVGEGNSYGHPSPATISALEGFHAKVLRTDRDGSIAVEIDDHKVTFERENSRIRFLQLK
jgi:competence protein ComEC